MTDITLRRTLQAGSASREDVRHALALTQVAVAADELDRDVPQAVADRRRTALEEVEAAWSVEGRIEQTVDGLRRVWED